MMARLIFSLGDAARDRLIGKTPVRYVRYPGEGHGNRKAAARDDYARRLMERKNATGDTNGILHLILQPDETGETISLADADPSLISTTTGMSSTTPMAKLIERASKASVAGSMPAS